MPLTVFSIPAYSFFAPRSGDAAGQANDMMHAARFYYYAFTYRFSYGERRPGRGVRASDVSDLKS